MVTLHFLGCPEGTVDERPLRLHSVRTWGVLAALVLAPRGLSRDVLKRRFFGCFDSGSATKGLTQALTSLRKELGAVESRADHLVLLGRERFRTDLEEVERALEPSPRTQSERAAQVAHAVRFLRGEFLEGLNPEDDEDGWLIHQRDRYAAQSSQLLLRYAEVLEAQGDFRAAFDAARDALEMHGFNPQAQALLLRMGIRTDRRTAAEVITRFYSFNETLDRVRLRESTQGELSPGESLHFERLLSHRLTELPADLRTDYFRLAVFERPFTPALAQAVTRITCDQLTLLQSSGLLVRTPEGYAMGNLLRSRLWGLLADVAKARLTQVFVHRYTAWLLKARPMDAAAPDPDHLEDVRCTTGHLPILARILESAPLPDRLVNLGLVLTHLEIPEVETTAERLLAAVLAVAQRDPSSPWTPCHGFFTAGVLTDLLRRFAESATWYQRALDAHPGADDGIPRAVVARHLAFSCHHAPLPQRAQSASLLAIRYARELDPRDELVASLSFHSEILRSAEDYAAAFTAGEEALRLARTLAEPGPRLAQCLYQLAITLATTPTPEAALPYLDESLHEFWRLGDTHGVADCFRCHARIALTQGRASPALGWALGAQALYDQHDHAASSMGARVLVGKALWALGDHDRAREEWQHALAYWETAAHPNWTSAVQSLLDQAASPIR